MSWPRWPRPKLSPAWPCQSRSVPGIETEQHPGLSQIDHRLSTILIAASNIKVNN